MDLKVRVRVYFHGSPPLRGVKPRPALEPFEDEDLANFIIELSSPTSEVLEPFKCRLTCWT